MQDHFQMQAYLQRKSYGLDVAQMTTEDLADYIRTMTLAATAELHEALEETPWKPWAKSDKFDREAFLNELADVQIFLLNLVLAGGDSWTMFETRIAAKQARNAQRQRNSYDGKAEKCPHCGRELDKPEAFTVNREGIERFYFVCSGCRRMLDFDSTMEIVRKYFPTQYARLQSMV